MMQIRGLDILAQRIAEVPQYLQQTLACPLSRPFGAAGRRQVVTTGIGSSEAAAKYLTALLNRSDCVSAEYLPTAAFYGELSATTCGKELIVFTQGLSPNAQIALERRDQFAGLTLVTSSTLDGQRLSGKIDRADLLQKLASEGATIITHPLEDEFEILPRIIGPICALLTAWRLAQSILCDNASTAVPIESMLQQVWEAPLPADDVLDRCAVELLAGTDFYFTNSSSLYAQNLTAKVLETVFRAPPRLRDVFDYSHGPFQSERAHPKHRWVFTGDLPAELDLYTRLQPLFERIDAPTIIRSPLPEPFAIFYYERFLNEVVLRAVSLAAYDLVDWPGKGEDGEGYALQHAYWSTAD
jgi:creatinine amidohydrolase